MSVQIVLSSEASGTPVADAASGDRFKVQLKTPFIVKNPEEYGVQVMSASVWYTSPNVSAFLQNNKFTYTSTAVAPLGTFAITLPDALYSTDSLTSTLADFTTQNGHGTLTAPLFTFVPLVAIQKVAVTVDTTGTIGTGFTIDNSIADSVSVSLMSFLPVVLGPTAQAPETFTPPAIADMAQGKNEYIINTDLIRGSIATDGGSSQAILSLPLDKPANSQLTYKATLPLLLPIARGRVDSISVWITDGNGNNVTLNHNAYRITIAIKRMRLHDVVDTDRQL